MIIIFDLDGTLSDPKEGITQCVQYALKEFGIKADCDQLTSFIGPPLMDSFKQCFRFTDKEAVKAIEKYRERFDRVGKYENILYPGIKELLSQLKAEGYKLAVGSSKPEKYVIDILKYFKIYDDFDIVVGSEMNGERIHKKEVIEEVFSRNGKREKAIMIGDRKFDIEGAKENNIPSIGVLYGYGSVQELKDAQPDRFAFSVAELSEQIKTLI